jgi:hypothetical protein
MLCNGHLDLDSRTLWGRTMTLREVTPNAAADYYLCIPPGMENGRSGWLLPAHDQNKRPRTLIALNVQNGQCSPPTAYSFFGLRAVRSPPPCKLQNREGYLLYKSHWSVRVLSGYPSKSIKGSGAVPQSMTKFFTFFRSFIRSARDGL